MTLCLPSTVLYASKNVAGRTRDPSHEQKVGLAPGCGGLLNHATLDALVSQRQNSFARLAYIII